MMMASDILGATRPAGEKAAPEKTPSDKAAAEGIFGSIFGLAMESGMAQEAAPKPIGCSLLFSISGAVGDEAGAPEGAAGQGDGSALTAGGLPGRSAGPVSGSISSGTAALLPEMETPSSGLVLMPGGQQATTPEGAMLKPAADAGKQQSTFDRPVAGATESAEPAKPAESTLDALAAAAAAPVPGVVERTAQSIMFRPVSPLRDRENSMDRGPLPVAGDALAGRLENLPRPAALESQAAAQLMAGKETVMRLEELADKFDQRMLSMIQRDEKVMKITVEPASMGRVTVLCKQENESMTVEIHVQHQAVRDLLARQENEIRRVMMESNVDLGGFDVLMGQQRDERQENASERSGSRREVRGIVPATVSETDSKPIQSLRKRNAASWVA